MDFVSSTLFGSRTAFAVMMVCLTVALGMALGRIRIGKVQLGSTWILFSGIAMCELGVNLQPELLSFIRDFGLTLFVFSIGLQIGPSFFSSLRERGLRLMWLAVLVMLTGVGVTYAIHLITGYPLPTLVGVLDGAVANTPAMGATEQALRDTTGCGDPSISMAFAVSYPVGIVATILTFMLLRALLRLDLDSEISRFLESNSDRRLASKYSIEITNEQLTGKTVGAVKNFIGRQMVVSRVSHDGENAVVANEKTQLYVGDKIFVVSSPEDKEAILAFLGKEIAMLEEEWGKFEGQLVSRRIIITKSEINGKRLQDLRLRSKYDINITRINRAGVDLIPYNSMEIQIGDRVTVVGSEDAVKQVEEILGNSSKKLSQPHIFTIFFGIAIGVLVGSIPLLHIPQPVKLGLAAGPMLVAILIGRFGTHWHMITYTTVSANLMIREVGISMFLASVGLMSGNGFLSAVLDGGYIWVVYAVIIAVLPLLIVGFYAHLRYRMDYFTILGTLSGSMTNPIALGYTNSILGSDVPSVYYATVYPLTMFLRVVLAQMMILFLM